MSDCGLPDSPPSRSGKFLRLDGQLFLIKGVSYGTFAPDAERGLFPDVRHVARDFEAIADLEANTVRTYTVPPVDVLDEASRWGLRLILGVPWMQHVAFLDRRADERGIRRTLRDHVRRLSRHPAAMLFALGNEISPSVVRWYGRQRIERFLHDLYDDVKSAAPDALLTYVNYPPTEYLETPWFDVCAFNLFLHSEEDLSAYLGRLHHIADSRPLLISELGADSRRSDEARQAALVRLQLRTVFREGACGAVVFTWTDDWWRGGRAVDDWAFGLVDVERRPKQAYHEVQGIFRAGRLEASHRLPRVSVVVCAYNAADTIDECLAALEAVNYPDFEVIVVNDGSTDGTGAAAARYRFARVINTAQEGLSAARNVGLAHATGEIIAYTDADVRVDPEWLTYLVQPFSDPGIGAAGGPAIVPADDPWFAQCVARSPGAPTPVLLDDRIAEHVPGCNCAFRTHALAAIGGFNPLFRRAGDDVDVCWRIQGQGWNIGFAPAALVWHRHRASTRAYWRQQIGYGEGETWLMREHQDKFVRGRIDWHGHIYSPLPFVRSLRTRRINTGPFGTAGFPSVYRTDARAVSYLPHSGRWQIAWIAALAAALAAFSAGSRLAIPLLAAAVTALAVTAGKCLAHGLRTDVERLPAIGRYSRVTSAVIYRLVIAWLHFVQPFARLSGRIRGLVNRPESAPRFTQTTAERVDAGLRLRDIGGAFRLFLSLPAERSYWSERWVDIAGVLRALADRLRQQRAVRQIEIDSGWWEDRDLTVVPQGWFRLDVRGLVEDHGGGKCLHRFAVQSRLTTAAALPLLIAAATAGALRYTGVSWFVAIAFVASGAVVVAARGVLSAARLIFRALDAVATGMGMSVLSSHETARTDATRRRPAAEPAGLTLTNRAIGEQADAAGVFVGDG